MVELVCIWLWMLEEINVQVVEVCGWEYVEVVQQVGKGIVFMILYFGCFEIIVQYYLVFGDVIVFYCLLCQVLIQ